MHGLLEWHGTVHSKGVKMKVDFTNGSVTAYGVAPATFITRDSMTQAIMENSDEFKSGRIRLYKTVPLPGETDERVVAPNEKVNAVPAASAPDEKEENKEDGVNVKNDAVENGGKQKVAVADKGEAIEWLKERNPEAGYTAAKLRSKEAFDNACAENNVEFVF